MYNKQQDVDTICQEGNIKILQGMVKLYKGQVKTHNHPIDREILERYCEALEQKKVEKEFKLTFN